SSITTYQFRPPNQFIYFTLLSITDIYTLSLHDALPIFLILVIFLCKGQILRSAVEQESTLHQQEIGYSIVILWEELCVQRVLVRSEEHTSELQSRFDLVCSLLHAKTKNTREYDVRTSEE